MQRAIAISGTPGTGKTAIGLLLANQLKFQFIDLSQIIKEQELIVGTDLTRETLVADPTALREHILQILNQSTEQLVVVGHFVDELQDELLEAIIVLRCNPLILAQRLRERQWSDAKILENLQAEILGDCTAQSLSRHPKHKIFEVDTSTRTIQESVDTIKAILSDKKTEFLVGKISWLRTMEPKLLHQIMEENQLPHETQKA